MHMSGCVEKNGVSSLFDQWYVTLWSGCAMCLEEHAHPQAGGGALRPGLQQHAAGGQGGRTSQTAQQAQCLPSQVGIRVPRQPR